MNSDLLNHSNPDQFQQLLPSVLTSMDAQGRQDQIEAMLKSWTPTVYEKVFSSLLNKGEEFRIYPAQPHCQQLSRDWLKMMITDFEVVGIEHLLAAMESPTVIVTNHCAYIDANIVDAMLAWSGYQEQAAKIAYLAGPKVFEDMFRVVACTGINILPVPQSTQFEHTQKLSRRELGRRALASVRAGQEVLESGGSLLFFPEGSRTRDGKLGSFLKATRRYYSSATYLLPAVLEGTEAVMPLGCSQMQPGPVRMVFAPPILLEGRDPKEVLVEARAAICERLPASAKPDRATPPLK